MIKAGQLRAWKQRWIELYAVKPDPVFVVIDRYEDETMLDTWMILSTDGVRWISDHSILMGSEVIGEP